MANRDAPSGLRAAKHLSGGIPGRLAKYTLASAYGSSISVGDAVSITGTGRNVSRPAGTDDDVLVGAADGVFYILADGSPKYERYWPAAQVTQTGSVREVLVSDDPNQVFEIQADEDIEAGDIGALAGLALGTGNPLTGNSGDELDSSNITTGTTLRILGLVDRVDNDYGNFAKVLVQINMHQYRGVTGV
jgi:hypothetical protein